MYGFGTHYRPVHTQSVPQTVSLGKLHKLSKYCFYHGLIGMASEKVGMEMPGTGFGRYIGQAVWGHTGGTNL